MQKAIKYKEYTVGIFIDLKKKKFEPIDDDILISSLHMHGMQQL